MNGENHVAKFFRNCSHGMVVVEMQNMDVGQQLGDLSCEDIRAQFHCWHIESNFGVNGYRGRVSHLKRCSNQEIEQDDMDTSTKIYIYFLAMISKELGRYDTPWLILGLNQNVIIYFLQFVYYGEHNILKNPRCRSSKLRGASMSKFW